MSQDEDTTAASEQPFTAFVRGTGSAFPGFNDPDLKDGHGGVLFPIGDLCDVIDKIFGVHNPATGKPVDRDWALRNMGMKTYSVGNVTAARECAKQFVEKGIAITARIDDDAVDVSELELCFRAFDEAMENARLTPAEVDVLIHVSPTLEGQHFMEGVAKWKEQYPSIREDAQLEQHWLGCPAFLIELRQAVRMLHSHDVNNVVIVCSNHTSGRYRGMETLEQYCRDNDMSLWVNMIVFGDGAAAVVVSSDATSRSLPDMVYDVVDVDYKRDHTEWVSTIAENNGSTIGHMYKLNVSGVLLIKGAMDHWCRVLNKRHGFSLSRAQHVALHTANPRVLDMMIKWYRLSGKVSLLAHEVGNLGPASCVTNLHDILHGTGGRRENKHDVKHGETIFGFSLGAATGVVDGVFLLRARNTKREKNAVDVGERGKWWFEFRSTKKSPSRSSWDGPLVTAAWVGFLVCSLLHYSLSQGSKWLLKPLLHHYGVCHQNDDAVFDNGSHGNLTLPTASF